MPSRADWDARYSAAGESLAEPDSFLRMARRHLPDRDGARAADVACGGGRNAVQLAKWGLATTAIDYSGEALRLCRERAVLAGVSLDTICTDLESPDASLGAETYDVIAVFNFLHRPLIPRLKEALRCGGVIVYKTYTRKQLGFGRGPKNSRFLLGDGELPELFADLRQLLYLEKCDTDATAALVAQRSC